MSDRIESTSSSVIVRGSELRLGLVQDGPLTFEASALDALTSSPPQHPRASMTSAADQALRQPPLLPPSGAATATPGPAAPLAAAAATPHEHKLWDNHSSIVVKLTHPRLLTQESLQHALVSVAHELHRIRDAASAAAHFDWFHHKHAELNAMTTPGGKSTKLFGSVLNLVNGTLGSGILAMPLMFSLMGWLLGTIMLACVTLLGIFTTSIMVHVGLAEKTESYHMTIHHTLGPRWMRVFQYLILAGVLGGLLAYLIVIGDFSVSLVSSWFGPSYISRQPLIALVAVLFAMPLALLRSVKSLWFTGFVAMSCAVFFVVALAYTALSRGRIAPGVHAVHTSSASFFRALPLAVLSFGCHNSVFPVFHEMRRKTQRSFTTAAIIHHSIVFVLYLTAGLAGYFLFASDLTGNVLQKFSGGVNPLMLLVTLGLLFVVVFAFPMGNFALRISLHHLLFGETDTTTRQHVLETLVPFVLVLTASMFVTDLGTVYGLLGSVTSCSFALLFPTAICLNSHAPRTPTISWICRAVFVFGVVLMVLGVYTSLFKPKH